MAVTKSESDGAHPASHYLVVEDSSKPSTWHLRVKDASGKLDTRLLGAAHAALTKGFRGNTYQGPNKQAALARLRRLYKQAGLNWPEEAKHSMQQQQAAADFAAVPVEEPAGQADDMVLRRGLVFRCGVYEDKDFALTPDEALDVVAEFEPVPVDLEHTSTLLDGQLGELRGIEIDPDGERIWGTVALPQWLDNVLPSRKVSLSWDRHSKRISKLALVREPRVTDAALMSAYADFARPRRNTPTGRRHLQMLHDITVEHGATCGSGSGAQMSQFASPHEARTIQAIHDMCAQHGAQCETMDNVRDNGGSGGDVSAAPMIYSAPQKERKRMNLDFKALFSGLFGAIEEREQATPPQPPSQSIGQPVLAPARAQDIGNAPYTVQATGNASFPTTAANGAYPQPPAVTTAPLGTAVPSAVIDPRVAELEKQLAERDATIAREAEARIQREASIFAEEQVRAQKATPAEQEKLALTFAQAMRDDQRSGSVTFGEGDSKQTTSRVQQLRDVYEARPAGLLTQQMLPDGQNGQQASAVFNKQTTERTGPDGKKVEGPLSAERRRALLEGSSLGRTIVRDEGATAKNGKN